MRTNPAGFRTPHNLRNRIARVIWQAAYVCLFRPTPWFMGAWRSWLLRRFGARIKFARLHPSAKIWAPWLLELGEQVYVDMNVNLYNPFGIRIGDRVVISQGTFLCSATHDYRDPRYALTGDRICIEDDCWIAAEAFVGPGVTISEGVVVGARSVVVKNPSSWTVVVGNPAKAVRQRALSSELPPPHSTELAAAAE